MGHRPWLLRVLPPGASADGGPSQLNAVFGQTLSHEPARLLLGPGESMVPAEPGVSATTTPSHPELFLLYVASGLAAVCALLPGLIVSLWRPLHTKGAAGI